jgi:hypothetical protein
LRRNKRSERQRRRPEKAEQGGPLRHWASSEAAPREKKTAYIQIPDDFSFISNPEDAIDALEQLVNSLRDNRVNTVSFDHSRCENLDLCASAVMDALFIAGQRSARHRGRRIGAGGFLSKANDDVNVLLRSNGILKNLNHPNSKKIPPGLMKRIKIFPLKAGHRTPPAESSDVELTASRLVGFFNDCLEMEGFRLRDEKGSNLMDLIAEVVVNAEEHSGESGDRLNPAWYAIGYYKRSEDPEKGGECHIALFNFGRSIFESLKLPETSDKLKGEISKLAEVHRIRGYFAILVSIPKRLLLIPTHFWQEEALWTLYAMQEGVSRFRHLPEGVDRGNGTVRMIEFFMKLASQDPKMVVLSGRTWILFDGTHALRTIIRSGEERQVMAFNEQNDLSLPPDWKFVRTLSRSFPGTLVSLKFTLRAEDLAKSS